MTKANLIATTLPVLLLALLPFSLSFSYNRYPTGVSFDNPAYANPQQQQQQQQPEAIPPTGVSHTQKDWLKQYLLNATLYATAPTGDAEDQQEQAQEAAEDMLEAFDEQMEQVQETLEQALEITNERIQEVQETMKITTTVPTPAETAEDPVVEPVQETLEQAQETMEEEADQVLEILKHLTQTTEEQADQVEEILEQAQETAEDQAEQVQEIVEDAQEAAEEQTEQAQETAEEQAEQAQETAEEQAEQAQETAEEQAEQAQETAEEQAEQVQETVEDAQEAAEQQTEQAQESLEDVLESTEEDDDELESEDTDDVTTTIEPESMDTDDVTTMPEPESVDTDEVTAPSEPESEDTDDVTTMPEPESVDTDDVTTPSEPESADTDDVITTSAPASGEIDEELYNPALCDDCEFRHGVGYNPHPSDCTLFIQCRMGSKGYPVVAGVQSCPHGMYWNQKKLTCDFRQNVQCLDDVCVGYQKTKRSRASCRGYWDCSSGTNMAKCCPKGSVYDPSSDRCVDQPDCQDDCLTSTSSATMECGSGYRAVPGNIQVYETRGPGNTWTRMPCPANTAFTTNPCGCNIRIDQLQQQQKCTPELSLPFDTDHRDPTGRVWVKNEGVVVKDGLAYFNGSGSRLTINRFSYAWWGSTVYVNIRYKSVSVGPGFGSRQALLSNGDCQVRPSLAMCAGPQGVDFYAETQGNALPVNFTVPYGVYAKNSQTYLWKSASFNLDSNQLQGYVNYQMKEAVANGVLESRKRGLVIGSGGGCEDFHGYIDKVVIYLCRPYYTDL